MHWFQVTKLSQLRKTRVIRWFWFHGIYGVRTKALSSALFLCLALILWYIAFHLESADGNTFFWYRITDFWVLLSVYHTSKPLKHKLLICITSCPLPFLVPRFYLIFSSLDAYGCKTSTNTSTIVPTWKNMKSMLASFFSQFLTIFNSNLKSGV